MGGGAPTDFCLPIHRHSKYLIHWFHQSSNVQVGVRYVLPDDLCTSPNNPPRALTLGRSKTKKETSLLKRHLRGLSMRRVGWQNYMPPTGSLKQSDQTISGTAALESDRGRTAGTAVTGTAGLVGAGLLGVSIRPRGGTNCHSPEPPPLRDAKKKKKKKNKNLATKGRSVGQQQRRSRRL